jgi:hypothetical protein
LKDCCAPRSRASPRSSSRLRRSASRRARPARPSLNDCARETRDLCRSRSLNVAAMSAAASARSSRVRRPVFYRTRRAPRAASTAARASSLVMTPCSSVLRGKG